MIIASGVLRLGKKREPSRFKPVMPADRQENRDKCIFICRILKELRKKDIYTLRALAERIGEL